MLVLTASEMRAVDRLAIEKYRVPGTTLMENAGKAVARIVAQEFGHVRSSGALVISGKGNNGGDGFVVARLLRRKGIRCSVALVGEAKQVKGDAASMLERYVRSRGRLLEVKRSGDIGSLQRDLAGRGLVIDAIFGTGLTGAVGGLAADVIELVNSCGQPVVAVDVPSGLDSDRGVPLGPCVQADLTVTLAAPKLGLLLFPGAGFAGRLVVADIGIPAAAFAETRAKQEVLVGWEVGARIIPRAPDSHKGTHGHLGIVAGSLGKTGAAILCGRGAQRAGAGLVTVACPASINQILEAGLLEVMTQPIADGGRGVFDRSGTDEIARFLEGKSAAVIGPGMGAGEDQRTLVRALVREAPLPLVIDADGLNCLVGAMEYVKEAAEARILTPHPGEMARLIGTDPASVQADRVGVARGFAAQNRCHLVLKGARTVVASPDGRVAINLSGNPGLASGGTGDVLAGVIGALLAQGYPPADACEVGVFVHGLAADIMAEERGEIGLIASDVVEALPEAFLRARQEFEAKIGEAGNTAKLLP